MSGVSAERPGQPALKTNNGAFQRLVPFIGPNNHAFHSKQAFASQKNYIDMHFISTDFEGAHQVASSDRKKSDGSVALSTRHPRKIINIPLEILIKRF